MKLTPKFNVADLMKGVRSEIEKMEQLIITKLNRVGLQFVINARSKVSSKEYKDALGSMSHAKGMRRAELGPDSPSFTDRTGNLRSSIGYKIFQNGISVSENFEKSGKGSDPEKGVQKAKDFADEVARNTDFNTGFLLVCVAGMEYAVYVEGYGYDVITGSSLLAENDLKEAFRKL